MAGISPGGGIVYCGSFWCVPDIVLLEMVTIFSQFKTPFLSKILVSRCEHLIFKELCKTEKVLFFAHKSSTIFFAFKPVFPTGFFLSPKIHLKTCLARVRENNLPRHNHVKILLKHAGSAPIHTKRDFETWSYVFIFMITSNKHIVFLNT